LSAPGESRKTATAGGHSPASRRPYGSGALFERIDSAGRVSWYGKWRANGMQVKRKVGLKRADGARDGLTRRQAEAELRRLMGEVKPSIAQGERLSLQEVADRYVRNAERKGRKPSTCANIESDVRVHLAPFFAGKTLDAIGYRDVADLIAALEGKGLAPKTIRNVVASLSAIYNFARAPQRRWASSNPCEGVELPAVPETTEVRFLTLEEVDALIAHLPQGMFLKVDRALFLAAALTGLRKGELVALRWRDVDRAAQRIRVRRNYTRGVFGTPKSRRSARAVPLAEEVAHALDRLREQSRWQGDDDLVFAHPETGGVLAKANISRRMLVALKAAGVGEGHRFHDLRYAFGTRAAAAGVPMRTLQEWMGHRDIQTTMIYADYSPGAHEADMIARAFRRDAPAPLLRSAKAI
jgi:integrase